MKKGNELMKKDMTWRLEGAGLQEEIAKPNPELDLAK